MSSKIFDALTELGENFIIKLKDFRFVIRPGTLDKTLAGPELGKLSSYNYRIFVTLSADTYGSNAASLIFKAKAADIEFSAMNGSSPVPVAALKKPLKVEIPYSERDWYKEGKTSAYVYSPEKGIWEKQDTYNLFDSEKDEGYIGFEMSKVGKFAAADTYGGYYTDIGGHMFEDAISNVSSVHELKSIKGRKFEPDKECTIGDAVKFMLDAMDYNYGNDYMNIAVKSGLISRSDVNSANVKCTREKAIAMVVRLYELKTGTVARTEYKSYTIFNDMDKVDPGLVEKVSFAAENGIAIGKTGKNLMPDSIITRGEIMGLLERMMMLSGEI